MYLCMLINIIHFEETIQVEINFWYSQYFQRRSTVVYLKFDYFKQPSSEIWLFETAIIGSYVHIYINVRGKYFLKLLINRYFSQTLNNTQNK